MPRFAVLTHDHPHHHHWDLLIEQGQTLRAWRLASAPDAGGAIAAEALSDHRTMYLDYEGPVSGGRGEVHRWDRGDYELVETSPTRIVVRLSGERLSAIARLELADDATGWTFRLGEPIPKS